MSHSSPQLSLDTGVPESPILHGPERDQAVALIESNHYTRSVPSGKSHYVRYGDAIVVWSIPANRNIARFLLGEDAVAWELSRLWAPDGHAPNLLTKAVSEAVKAIRLVEAPAVLVSYADPNVGHHGGIYRAASWIACGTSEEVRAYRGPDGAVMARRAFHSGRSGLTKAQIEARGFREERLPGKVRFAKPLTRRAKRLLAQRMREGALG